MERDSDDQAVVASISTKFSANDSNQGSWKMQH